MFELNGQSLTLEDLQGFAKDNNMDFDAYMANMKNAGMVEKTTDSSVETQTMESNVMDSGSGSGLLELPEAEDVAKSASTGAFYDSDLPSNIKKGMTIVNVIKALPQIAVDSEERAKLGKYLKNRIDNVPEAFQSALISAGIVARDIFSQDIDYDPDELEYLKTQDPNAPYVDPMGDPTGFKTNADKVKYLESYAFSNIAKRRDKAEDVMIKKYQDLEQLEFKDTGKGIVAGAKEGDAASLIAGVFGAGVSMAETAIPAALTFGASLPVQVAAPMYTDYNKAKAKQLYGDDPDAIKKLVENNQTEIAVPLALGAVATGLEYIGLKGVTKYIQSVPGKGTQIAKLLWTGSGEGFTEVGQLGVEKLNQGLGAGKSTEEASKDAWDAMTSDEGLEMWLNGFLGAGQMSVGGRALNRALRSDNASVKDLNSKINNLADLNNKKYNTRNQEVKEAIDLEIKEAEKDLKNYITEKRKISEILNEDQKQSLINTINKKDNIKSKVESLKTQLQDGNISTKEFGYAIRGLNNQDKRLSEEIDLINATAKEQLLQTSLETTKQETEKLGLEQVELSQEEFAKQFPDDTDSDGAIQGNKIFINRDVARETGAIGVGSHELLHGIIGNSYQKLGKEEKVKLNTEFLNLLGSKEKQSILTRLANSYGITGDKVFETEELFTAFSDEIVDGGLAFNEGVFGKVKNTVHKVLNKFGYKKEFESARQTYNFLKDYSKNIKQGKLTERAAEFAKEDPGVEGERFSKEASDKVQNIYEEQGEAGAFEIIEQFKPIVSKIAEKRREAPNFDKELLMSEIEIGERGILDLISKYDPDSGVPLAAYINKFLPSRAIEASRRVLGEEFTEDVSERVDIAAEEVAEVEVEAKPKKKKIILSDRLGVKGKVDKAIKTKLPELDIENLNFKTLKDQTPEITGEMFGISPKKLISGANITKKELQSAQMFINKNADVLISMLPEGATAGGTATGVPQTLLKAFYTKTDRAKMAKTGNKAGLAVQVKNDIKKTDFLETFGIIDGKPDRTDRNTSARVLALANQTGKMMTNQAVRQELVNQGQPLQALGHIADGKATVMFSKSKQAIGAIDRSLSPSARVLFWDDISAFTNEDILDRSLESIKIGLLNTYGNIPEITGKIDELATALHKVIKNLKDPVVKNPIKLTEKLLETNNKQLSKVKEFFNSIMTAADAFRQPQRVKNFRATTSVLANKIFNPSSLEKSIAKILMMRGHLASSSRNSYLKRKQPYPGNPEFLEGTLGSIPGIEYKTKLTKDGKTQLASVTYKGKNISLKKITSSQTSKAALNDAKDISKLKERSKNEDLAIELLDEITDFYTELYNNGEIDNVDLQMVSASLLSNMDAVLARAAKLKYISDNAYNFENPGKEVKYEHMQPRVAVLLNLWDAKINGDGIADVKDFLKNYTIQVIPNTMDKVITESKLGESLYVGQTLDMPSWIRTYNEATKENDKGRLRPLVDVYTKKVLKPSEAIVKSLRILKPDIKKTKTLNKAIQFSRSANNESKGITVLDFDDTLATSKSLVISTSPEGVVRKLTAEEFATEGADLLDQGWTHDFSEFSKVVDGKVASLFKKAMKLQGKFGPENMFVLTARPADSAPAIFEFLKANGLNIPLKNITGLANSTSEAKALWIADKVGEGYNDFYFADDALQNVQAVANMLDQFDVKSKVQQAKVKFSKSMNDQFNDILENVTGIEANKRFSIIKGRKRGEGKGKFRVFIPPSHEDFVGLLYNFLGKGKEGNAHRDFFEQALIRPLNRANREFDTARQSVANDYKELNKQFEDVRKKLTKKTADGDFTFQDAIRVYLWDKHGHKIPGLSETDQAKLAELVMSDPQLQAYAETLNVISKQETYVNPTDGWNGGDIRMDLDDATGRIGRKQFFSEFIENADVIFSEENLNKIEAGYGKGVRESLEDMLYRIETGRNRPTGQNEQVNNLMNYLNGSVGTVMFFNMRSALLQQMSIVNYINFADNNIFAAAKAFANQKQYWKDFAFIFNSDMLKQRRGGIQTDVNGAELAASLRNSKDITRKLISKLLELGFLPTQIGDNIAIATGGAAYYRNRINKYVKQGMSQKEAEAAAFTDFQDITQSTQQSARPDMVSKQQASVIGKVILNFQNVTSQFNRLGKKAFQDIYNRRITKPNSTQMQSDISNAARITYYFAIQNAIFYTLQTALFAMMFDDDEEDVNNLFIKKQERLINGSIDSVLRGSGLIGGVVATLKNVAIAFARQRDVKYNPDESAVGLEALNLSPVLGIKLRKIVNAEKTLNYNKKVIKEMETFDIDNPQWSAVTNYTEAFTNIPLNRLYNKTQNVRQSLNNDHAAWERTLMFLGWSQYNLNLENKKMEEIKEKTKGKKKKSKKSKTYRILK